MYYAVVCANGGSVCACVFGWYDRSQFDSNCQILLGPLRKLDLNLAKFLVFSFGLFATRQRYLSISVSVCRCPCVVYTISIQICGYINLCMYNKCATKILSCTSKRHIFILIEMGHTNRAQWWIRIPFSACGRVKYEFFVENWYEITHRMHQMLYSYSIL